MVDRNPLRYRLFAGCVNILANRAEDAIRSIELGQAKDQMDDLVEGARKPVDLAALRRLTETLPPQSLSAVDLMRAVRDDNACCLTSRYKTPKR